SMRSHRQCLLSRSAWTTNQSIQQPERLSWIDWFVVHADLLNRHCRWLRIELYLCGIDHGHAFDGGEPQFTVGAAPAGRMTSAAALARYHAVGWSIKHRRERFAGPIGEVVQLFPAESKDSLVR